MNTMIKKVYRDLVKNKSKTILIMLTLIVGSLAVGVVTMFNSFFVPEVKSVYQSAQPYDIKIKTNGFDAPVLEKIRDLPGVKNLEATSSLLARLQVDGKSYNTNLMTLNRTNSVNIISKQDGTKFIPDLGPNEIYIERSSLTEFDKKPGDNIKLLLKGNSGAELRIKDYVYDAVSEPYTLEGDMVAFVSPDTYKQLSGEKQICDIVVTVTNDKNSKQRNIEIANELAKKLETNGVEVNELEVPQPGTFYATQSLTAITIIMICLGTLAIILGLLMIFNVINSIMISHIRQIGIMKAIGGKTKQIGKMYFLMILVIGIISFIITLPLSTFVGFSICKYLAFMFNMEFTSFSVPFVLILIEFCCCVLTPLIATLSPIMKSIRATPYNALNDNIKGNSFKKSIIKGFSPSILVPVRNNFRNKLRLTLTITTLALSGAMFITGLNLQAGFNKTLNEAKLNFPDVILTLGSFNDASKLEQIFSKAEGVKSAEPWAFAPGKYIDGTSDNSKKILLMGPKKDSKITGTAELEKVLQEGRLVESNKNEVLISNHLTAFYPNIKVGDTIKLKLYNKMCEFKVVGRLSLFGQPAAPYLIGDYKYMTNLFAGENKVNDIRLITEKKTKEFQTEVSKRAESMLNKEGISVVEVNLGAAMKEQFKVSSGIAVALLMFLSIFVAIIGAMGLSGTLSLNVLERSRETGIMRSVGATNGILNKMVLSEGFIMTFISWFISLIISLPLTIIAGDALGQALFAKSPGLNISILGILAWLAFSTIASFIACIMPCRKINRTVTRELNCTT